MPIGEVGDGRMPPGSGPSTLTSQPNETAEAPGGADETAADARLEKLRAYYADVFERGQRYTGFLIAAGFAAFFTIWGGFRPIMPSWAILLTGAMIGTALILFIGYEIWKGRCMSIQAARLSAALLKATPATFDSIMAAENAISTRESLEANRLWPWVFYSTVVLGIGAAVLSALFGFLGAARLL